MKAFSYEQYGPPETLRIAEVNQPTPKAGEVLVKVVAASVNAADWHMLRGKPLFSRATLGLLRPKHKVLGVDVAGRVEAAVHQVTPIIALSWPLSTTSASKPLGSSCVRPASTTSTPGAK